MRPIDSPRWIPLAALLWVPLGASVQAADPPHAPPAAAVASNPVADMLSVARALKKAHPELFGEAEGVLATKILPDGQGAPAGLEPGDVLIGYGETPLDSARQLIDLTGRTPEDQAVLLHYLRGEQARDARIHGGRIGAHIRDLAETPLERMIALNQAGRQAVDQARYSEALALFQRGLALAEAEGSRSAEGVLFTSIGSVYFNLDRYREALSHYEQALAIRRELGDRGGEGANLTGIGSVYFNLDRYRQALSHYEQALVIRRELGDRGGEGNALGNIGIIYKELGRVQEALSHFEPVLAIFREIGDRRGEGNTLSNIGGIHANLGRYQEALSHHRQALAIRRELGDRRGEGADLTNIGNVYKNLGRYQEALSQYERALAIHREVGDRRGEGGALGSIGSIHANLGRYQEALSHHEQALAIARELGDRGGEGTALGNIGNVYSYLGRYQAALSHYEQALAIQRELGDRGGEGTALGNIGLAYLYLGRYQEALSHYAQALAIAREIGDRRGEGNTLSNIGNVYQSLGRYQAALSHHRQALAIRREIGDRQGEGDDLTNIGNVYQSLGRYQEALSHHRQALAIRREIGDRGGEGGDLNNIGIVYRSLGRYQEALSHFLQALAIAREIGNRRSEGRDLNNIGTVYQRLGRVQEALSHYQQALAVHREIGDREGQGAGLSNIGTVLRSLGRVQEALSHYGQALAIDREIGDRAAEAKSLVNIGGLHQKEGNPAEALSHYHQALAIEAEVGEPEILWRLWNSLRALWSAEDKPGPAIVAGKRAVNTLQAMRAASSGLDRALQQSFLQTKEHVYRRLADALIARGRIPEAEQVLAMLKEEELFDFIRRDDAADVRRTRASLTPAEQAWNARYERFSAELAGLGKEYQALIRIEDLSAAEEARLESLEAEILEARTALVAVLEALETELAEQGGEAAIAFGKAQLDWLENQQRTLAELGHGAALISTVVTKNRLHLILTTPDIQLARQSPIGAEALNALIGELRRVLTDPGADPLPAARALYDHLVAPLQADLRQAGSRTLMWSLDGALRYVPLAALHDGEHYLIERHPLVLYTAAAREHLGADEDNDWRVAGFGVNKAHADFSALQAVPGELEGIVKRDAHDLDGVIAGRIALDEDFHSRSLKRALRARFPVLHIASHFRLNPGDNSASYLLLGGGDRLTLADFHLQPAYRLDAVDLLTLSACNTAVGDIGRSASGAEVESFGALAQKRGAKGVLATLWSVDDESTGQLMQTLYRLRGNDAGLTKAEALRQAQLSLLRGSGPDRSCGPSRGPVSLSGERTGTGRAPADRACRYAHPYYWAPFVLMGNWL